MGHCAEQMSGWSTYLIVNGNRVDSNRVDKIAFIVVFCHDAYFIFELFLAYRNKIL